MNPLIVITFTVLMVIYWPLIVETSVACVTYLEHVYH